MTQKAEHDYQSDYQNSYSSSDGQSKWIWGSLAALAAIALILWLAISSGPSTAPINSSATTTEQTAPAPVAPPADPAVQAAPDPAAPPAQPAQPATGGTANPQ
jgi:hypothetical protein